MARSRRSREDLPTSIVQVPRDRAQPPAAITAQHRRNTHVTLDDRDRDPLSAV
ncbi:MAG TPA: hypothetical protein VF256_17185 [Streptosporangiaceae bacterium]